MKVYRLFPFLLLFCFPRLLPAQQLYGTYCYNVGFGSTCITFADGNRFSYTDLGCTIDERGTGIYTIVGDSLVLMFKTDDTVTLPVSWQVDATMPTSDSVKWLFLAVDETGAPLSDVFIRREAENRTTITDVDGRSSLVLPRSDRKQKLTAYLIGRKTNLYPVLLDQDRDYSIRITFNHADRRVILTEGITYRFPIRNITPHSFELKQMYEGAVYETYRKAKAR